MSSRVVYTCDRCKREFADQSVVRTVIAGVRDRYCRYSSSDITRMFERGFIEQDWCDECRRELHFLSNADLELLKSRGLPIPEQPTLEMQIAELVREMVGEMVADHIENGT